MASFIGSFEHNLDGKGRIFLPAKFRPPFQQAGGILSKNYEGCIALWTPDSYEEFTRRFQSEQGGARERNLERLWAASSYAVEIDPQGRLAIPSPLRDFAQLTGPVLVVGVYSRVELWNPELWRQRVEVFESLLLERSEESPGGGTA